MDIEQPSYRPLSAAEIATQQAGIDRQRKIAEYLQQQSFQEPQGQMVSGHYVPAGFTQNLSRLAQGLIGKTQQEALDKKQAGISKQQGDALYQSVGGAIPLQGGNSSQENPSSPNQSLVSPEIVQALLKNGSENAAVVNSNQMPISPTNAQSAGSGLLKIDGMTPQQAFAVRDADPKAYLSSFMKQFEQTDLQRNNRYLGISPEETRLTELAKRKKEGMYELQPGATSIDLSTGKERTAPKLGEGITLENGAAVEVPNYGDITARMKGKEAEAVSRAQSGYKTQVVDGQGGKRLMTDAQIINEANNGNGGVQGLDVSKLNSQQLSELAKKDPVAFANGIAQFQKSSQPNSQQNNSGVQLASDESKAFGVSVAKDAGEKLLKSRDQARAASDDLFGINESRKAIANGAFLGSGAEAKTDLAKAVKGWIGLDIAPDKVASTEYLRSTLGQRMLDNAKKLGVNPTDADAKRLDVIIGTISKDPRALSQLLDYQEGMLKKSLRQHNSDVDDAEQKGLKAPFNLRVDVPNFESASVFKNPQINELLKKYGAK